MFLPPSLHLAVEFGEHFIGRQTPSSAPSNRAVGNPFPTVTVSGKDS